MTASLTKFQGGGVIFNPKIYDADFGNFKQGFLSVKLILTDNNCYYLAYASLHKCDHTHCNIIFQKWGGSKAVWNFSKKSSDLEAGPFPLGHLGV